MHIEVIHTKLDVILCVLLLYAYFYVACKWRYPPFVTLILNNKLTCLL